MIKKLLKYLAIFFASIIGLAVVVYLLVDKPLPSGTIGLEAEQLTDQLLKAVNKEGFDTVEYIAFSFREAHHYEWWKNDGKVNVRWEDQEVNLDLNRSVDEYSLLELKAYRYFINDSFWLVAPFKVRDEGVTRATLALEEGKGLLVTYSSGGLTPGDSYLWIIDENGFPTHWKLWTSNVPIGGLKFSWDGWVNQNDVWFSTIHESAILSVPVSVSSVR